jgi:arylsulfatase A-like enzyme
LDAFMNLAELAPTLLEIAQAPIPPEMTLPSFLPLLKGLDQPERSKVFLERERHANVRKGDLSYPIRAVRTAEFLYIRNLRADRWPAGDPEMHKAVGPYGDCDSSPSKASILADPGSAFFHLAFAKRPAEELYRLPSDPAQTNNLAAVPEYAAKKAELAKALDQWMRETGDPRVDADADPWSGYAYFGNPEPMPVSTGK